MGAPLDRAIASHRRSVVLHGWLSSLGVHSGVALFLAGSAALTLRIQGWTLGPPWPWFVAPALLGVASSGVRAYARRPSRDVALAWLDLRCGGHGLMLAQDELEDPRWEQPALWQMDRAGTPKQPSGSGRWIPVALALVFMFGALRIPLRAEEVQKPTPLLERTLANLMGRLAGLEAEGLLDEASRVNWRGALEQIEEEIPRTSSGAIFEALDRLAAEMDAETLGAMDTNWLEEQALGVAMDLAGEDMGTAAGTFLAALESAAGRELPGSELMRTLARDAALAGAQRLLEGDLLEGVLDGDLDADLQRLLEGGLGGEAAGILRGQLEAFARGEAGSGSESPGFGGVGPGEWAAGIQGLLGRDGAGLRRMAEALARDLEIERTSLAKIGEALGAARSPLGGLRDGMGRGGEGPDPDPFAIIANLGIGDPLDRGPAPGGAGSEFEDPLGLDPESFGPILLSEAWTELDPDSLQQALEGGRLTGEPGAGSPISSDPAIATNPDGDPIPQAGRATWKRRIAPRHRGAVRQFFGEPPP